MMITNWQCFMINICYGMTNILILIDIPIYILQLH